MRRTQVHGLRVEAVMYSRVDTCSYPFVLRFDLSTRTFIVHAFRLFRSATLDLITSEFAGYRPSHCRNRRRHSIMSRVADGPPPAKRQCVIEGANYSYSRCSLFDNEYFETGQRDTVGEPVLSPTLREAFVGALASTGLKRTQPTPPPPKKKPEEREDTWLQKEVKEYLLREQKNDEIRERLRILHASIEPTAKLPDHLRGTIIPPRARIGEKRAASHFDLEDDDEKTDTSADNVEEGSEQANEDISGHIGTDTRFCVIEGWQTLYEDIEFNEGFELIDDYFRLFRFTNGRFMYQRHM
uniref:Uncharacterized protein n=1 Tax=Panagrellus redivivus TaxID=6233 RepID=A0A7E4UXC2_PANRE